MTRVADEQLGKLARQQADLFRRVREGSLDVEYVSRRLQEIIEVKPSDNIYPLSVDYGRSVEDGVKAGRYDWVNSDITSLNFPTKRKGRAEVVMELVHFNRYISNDGALRELDRMGYRPAELHELLAFGEKYFEVQLEFPVVALGFVWRGRGGGRFVPYLFRDGSKRYLYLGWIGDGWDEIYRFAAVRK
jgi:hypothetical protein